MFASREINGRGEWISATDFLAPDQALFGFRVLQVADPKKSGRGEWI